MLSGPPETATRIWTSLQPAAGQAASKRAGRSVLGGNGGMGSSISQQPRVNDPPEQPYDRFTVMN